MSLRSRHDFFQLNVKFSFSQNKSDGSQNKCDGGLLSQCVQAAVTERHRPGGF